MTERSRSRRVLSLVVMSVAVVAVVAMITADDEGWRAFRSVGAAAAVGLVGLQVLGLFTQAYRYRLAIDEAGRRPVPRLTWLRLFILGRFLNTLIPQAGNAYRSVRLKNEFGLPLSRYLGAFLAFVWLSTLVNLAAALVILLVFEPGLEFGAAPAAAVTAILLLVGAATPATALVLLRRIRVRPDSRVGWAHRRIEDMLSATVRVAQSGATLVRFGAAALAGLTLWVAVFSIAFDAVGIDASPSTVVLFYVLQQLGTYWNITPGNLGIQELYSGLLASQLGIGLTAGLVVAAVIRLTALVALLAMAVALGGLRALSEVHRDRVAGG